MCPAEFLVQLKEAQSEVRAAQMLEVGGEERRIVEHVDPAQPVVEIEAIQRLRPAVEAEDIVGGEVAVPVHAAATLSPFAEQGSAALDVPDGQVADAGVDLLAE